MGCAPHPLTPVLARPVWDPRCPHLKPTGRPILKRRARVPITSNVTLSDFWDLILALPSQGGVTHSSPVLPPTGWQRA